MKTVNNFVLPGHPMFQDSVRAFLPRKVVIPFRQSSEAEYSCGFQPGDIVREGQIIASPKNFADGANIHSSVPGKILSIFNCTLPNGTLGNAAEISTDGAFSYLGKKLPSVDWNFLNTETLLEEFKVKGIVNTFRKKTESLCAQITRGNLVKERFVIVRMFDEDPSRFTDSFIAKKFTSEVVQGALICCKAFSAKGIVFALPKKSDIEISTEFFGNVPFLFVNADTEKYPCGFMQNLLRTIRNASKNSEFSKVNSKCLFLDPETALSVFEAVVKGIPVIERYVHVHGSCLKSVGMFKARIGASIKSLVEQCGGFKISPSKIVVNGMITGMVASTLDIPITKSIKSLEFVPATELCVQDEKNCIRCGKCRNVCPEGLSPDLLYKHLVENYHLPKELCATSLLCSHCSVCNSVCPSRLPLSQTIALL